MRSTIRIAFLAMLLPCVFTQEYVWAGGLPDLPSTPYGYYDYAVTDLPQHFFTNQGGNGGASVVSRDNTPADNQITDAGATLGRVLFYDTRLSHGNGVACASCHHQENGFSDPDKLSTGVNGQTPRHSMALTNTKFYDNGRMFWDERAQSLEHQTLLPIQDEIEMDTTLSELVTKVENTSFYGDLFSDAFGTPEVNSDRISKAISQFVRSMVSYDSKFDSAFNANGQPNLQNVLTESERRGHGIFNGRGRCSECHQSNAQVGNEATNNGLDAVFTDEGAGNGQFKVPSLRNVEVREGFMHDGRFETLREVLEFYSTEIQNSPDLDNELEQRGQAIRFDFSERELDDLEAFLNSLTDHTFLNSEMFSNPFGADCDFDANGGCDVVDLNMMLAAGTVVDGVPVDASGNELFDLNGDGTVDSTDVSEWLAGAGHENGLADSYGFGDLNLDGATDSTDLGQLLNNFGSTESLAWEHGNLNDDGVVDSTDLGLLLNNFGAVASFVSVVPEPGGSSMTILGLICAFAAIRCRRNTTSVCRSR